jgi:CubicO group peptidase (beta-lactamase class C family)
MNRRDLLAAGAALTLTMPRVAGAQAALSPRLGPLRDVMQTAVARGLPGYVTLVAQGDDVVVDVGGMKALGGTEPMTRDTIFRIMSMTKAVTAAAVMMLVEEGKLTLDEPAERLLPELANRRVLKRLDGPLDDTEPARRPVAVRDIMDFTFGFGALFEPSTPIQQEIVRLKLANDFPQPMTPHAPDEWMRLFSTLPLMHQPGEVWMYNTGSILQGVLVARAAGQAFDAFLDERILGPLGMKDTGFLVPAEKLSRLAGGGTMTNPQTGKIDTFDGQGAASEFARPPAFPSGAAGLVSTADDYLQFARMLLARGTHQGRRLLSEASVAQMTTDHLSPAQKAASAGAFFPGFFDTHGWGFGVAIGTTPDALSAVPGRYGWDGGYGTSWMNDPARDLIGIAMTQSVDFLFGEGLQAFWREVYRATAG